jgi:uncharacterized integral membrane protein
MQIVRTVAWVFITAVLMAFIAINWSRVSVNFWPLDGSNYTHFEAPVGLIAILFFLLGMLPMWLYLRGVRWRLNRRIAMLENSLQGIAVLPTIPVASSTAASLPRSETGSSPNTEATDR